MKLFIVCLVFINVITFFIYGSGQAKGKKEQMEDSGKDIDFAGSSRKGVWRGAWLAMRMFRHKTRKPVFMYGIPVILLCQMGLYTYFFIS